MSSRPHSNHIHCNPVREISVSSVEAKFLPYSERSWIYKRGRSDVRVEPIKASRDTSILVTNGTSKETSAAIACAIIESNIKGLL